MSTITIPNKKNSPLLRLVALGGMTLLLLLTIRQVVPAPLIVGVSDWESLDVSISDFILRTETPEIPLTVEQIDEITALYNNGIEFNNNPNDPCRKLKLLGLKKLNKWVNQFKQRGFTVSRIRETLETGTRMTYNHPSGSSFTRIVHPDGSCIIVDFVDCVIWQIAPANFKF